MSISIMGSVNSYAKTMKLQTQWDLKQQNGDYNSHKKELAEWVNTAKQDLEKSQKSFGQTADDDDEKSKQKLQSIMQKIYAGRRLTNNERRLLQAKNPQAYQKLCATEQEQKAYERKLRRCRTKEEVQRLKMTHLASSLATVNSVSHNANIPTEKKLEICMQEKVRCDRLQESTHNFVRSGEYNRLPTELERAKGIKRKKFVAHIKPPIKFIEPEQKELEMPKEPETPDLGNSNNPDNSSNPSNSNSASQTGAPTEPTNNAQPATVQEKARAAYATPKVPQRPTVTIQA